MNIWKTERKAEVFNHRLEPALRQGLASFQERCTRQSPFLPSFLKFRRLSMLGNVVFQRAKMLPTRLLAVFCLKQIRCSRFLSSPTCHSATEGLTVCPLTTRSTGYLPCHNICLVSLLSFAQDHNIWENIWKVKKDNSGIFWTANLSLFHVSVTSRELGSQKFCAHILRAKIQKKLYDSAMNEMNTMYYIQFVYFNFITNGYYQGDLHFNNSFQLSADYN